MLDINKLKEQLTIATQGRDKAANDFQQWVGAIGLLESQIKMLQEQEELAQLEQTSKEELDGETNNESTVETSQE